MKRGIKREEIHNQLYEKHRTAKRERGSIPLTQARTFDKDLDFKRTNYSAYGYTRIAPHSASLLSKKQLHGMAALAGFKSVNATGLSILAGLVDQGIEEALRRLNEIASYAREKGYTGHVFGHPHHAEYFKEKYGGVAVGSNIPAGIVDESRQATQRKLEFEKTKDGKIAKYKRQSWLLLPSVYRHFYTVFKKMAHGLGKKYKMQLGKDNSATIRLLRKMNPPLDIAKLGLSEQFINFMARTVITIKDADKEMELVVSYDDFLNGVMTSTGAWKYLNARDILTLVLIMKKMAQRGDLTEAKRTYAAQVIGQIIGTKKKFFGMSGQNRLMTQQEFADYINSSRDVQKKFYYTELVGRNYDQSGPEGDAMQDIVDTYNDLLAELARAQQPAQVVPVQIQNA